MKGTTSITKLYCCGDMVATLPPVLDLGDQLTLWGEGGGGGEGEGEGGGGRDIRRGD